MVGMAVLRPDGEWWPSPGCGLYEFINLNGNILTEVEKHVGRCNYLEIEFISHFLLRA